MSAPRRILAVILFAAVGLLALAFTGLFDWIASVLFLALEMLAEALRPLFRRGRGDPHPGEHEGRHHPDHPQRRARFRSRPGASLPGHSIDLHRRRPRRKVMPAHRADAPPEEVAEATPRGRVLVPMADDRPGLVAFALGECRARRADLVVLVLRPLAVLPMGGAAPPGLDEDEPARALIARVGAEAEEAGVPFRALYGPTHDAPATILDAARACEADVVVMEAGRRNMLSRALWGDEVRALLAHLPGRVSLLLHSA